MFKLTIYSTPSCPYCVKAKQAAERVGLPYEECSILAPEHQAMRDAFREMGLRTVPQIYVGNFRIGGYEDLENYLAAHKELFDA